MKTIGIIIVVFLLISCANQKEVIQTREPDNTTLVWEDGENYEGELGGKVNGKGTISWENGESYEGEIENLEMNGQGLFTFEDGSTYEGGFRDNNFDGSGTLTFMSGEKYEGEFSKGKFSGQGNLTWANGEWYEGEFRDGKRHGEGTEFYSSGEVKEQGLWANNNLTRSTFGEAPLVSEEEVEDETKLEDEVVAEEEVDLGGVEDYVYTNEFFEFSLELPETWYVLGEEERKALGEVMSQSGVDLKYFLHTTKFPPTHTDFNPTFTVFALKSPEITLETSEAYSKGLVLGMESSGTEVIETKKLLFRNISGKEFSIAEMKISNKGITATNKFYLVHNKGYNISFSLIFQEDSMIEVTDILASLKFLDSQ